MANLFLLPDTNRDQLMVEGHYYKWLSTKNFDDVHFINTKTQYLESLGFIVGTDFITDANLQMLKAIEQYYVQLVLKPLWDSQKNN